MLAFLGSSLVGESRGVHSSDFDARRLRLASLRLHSDPGSGYWTCVAADDSGPAWQPATWAPRGLDQTRDANACGRSNGARRCTFTARCGALVLSMVIGYRRRIVRSNQDADAPDDVSQAPGGPPRPPRPPRAAAPRRPSGRQKAATRLGVSAVNALGGRLALSD
jgi:hypothetical protein